MWFWWFMFICNIVLPMLMIIAGRMMWKHPPVEINGTVGYRTARSKKNRDTWKFAHEYCGKLWWKIGWIMLIPSILLLIPFYGKSDGVVGGIGGICVIVQTGILIASIWPVEKALKENFTDDGIRKNK